jgi:hypothetical protein
MSTIISFAWNKLSSAVTVAKPSLLNMLSLNCKLSLQTQFKSSFYPLLNPITSPGTNPISATMGNPEAAIKECVANCDAVSLRVCNGCVVTFAKANLERFTVSLKGKSFGAEKLCHWGKPNNSRNGLFLDW